MQQKETRLQGSSKQFISALLEGLTARPKQTIYVNLVHSSDTALLQVFMDTFEKCIITI